MIWQCTFCDITVGSYDDPIFDACKKNHHAVIPMLNEIESVQTQDKESQKNISQEEHLKMLEGKRRKFQAAIEENFEDKWNIVEVCLSVEAQLLISDITSCFALFLMGQPSTSKSTILEIINATDDCYKSDKFTPKSFVSHSANSKKSDLEKVDLLPRIRHKTLVTPELAPLFTGNEENLVESFGILTRVLDGRGLEIDSGVHGKRGYHGDYHFMWLGAVVDIPHKVWKVVGNLGAKWFYLRLPEEPLTSEQKKARIKRELDGKPYQKKLEECQEAKRQFWEALTASNEKTVWDSCRDDKEAVDRIIDIAFLLSKLRASVPSWNTYVPSSSGTNYNFEIPTIEDPSRASRNLYNLARGHALTCGRNYITKDDLDIVIAVALSSAERERVALLKLLLSHKGRVDVETFKEFSKVSDNTARKEMQKMKILGLVDIESEDTTTKPRLVAVLKSEFAWFLSSEFEMHWERFTRLHTPKFSAESHENAEKIGVRDGQTTLEDMMVHESNL